MTSIMRAGLFGLGLALLVPVYLLAPLLWPVLGWQVGILLLASLSGAGLLFGIASHSKFVSSKQDILWRHEADAPHPVLLTDDDGQIIRRNGPAAKADTSESPSETIPSFLRSYIVDSNPRVFRIQEQLQTNEHVFETWATKLFDIDVAAHRLPEQSVLWKFRLRKAAQPQTDQKLRSDYSLSVGRSGNVLSMSNDLADQFDARPRHIKDFLFPEPDKDCGFAQMKCADGTKTCFYTLGSERLGRREYALYVRNASTGATEDVLNALPFPVLQLQLDGTVAFENQAMTEMHASNGFVGLNIANLLVDSSNPGRNWLESFDGRRGSSQPEFAVLTVGQVEHFVQVTFAKIEVGGRDHLLVFISDASELKSLEAQFVQSQKMQAIGQLAGGVAHDFNNLLTAISGHCDLLLLRHSANDPNFGDLEQIRQNANRAASLVGQLLAFSRKQTLHKETLDLERVLSDHTHLLNRLVGEKTVLQFNHGHQMKCIRADKRQLEQVIMNLVVNARDAMNGEGEIIITTSMRTFKEDQKKGRALIPAGEYCAIKVADTGCGIPADKHQRIFEPFYTSKKTGEGTGLGLSTVYGIVKQTGGFIFVDSVVGVGTSFEILFPSVKTRPVSAKQADETVISQDLSQKADGSVLLVEDEAPVRAFASRALRLKGFKVIEAANAEEALDILKDESLLIDVFVTDVVMPGKDGPTWVSEALSDRPGTRVVFVSGYAENHGDNMTDNIPNSTFLPKPFSLAELTSTVAQFH